VEQEAELELGLGGDGYSRLELLPKWRTKIWSSGTPTAAAVEVE
jgi:hypothetical protein